MKNYTVQQLCDKICELEAYEEHLQEQINKLSFSDTKLSKHNELRGVRRQLTVLKRRLYFDDCKVFKNNGYSNG